ncbi:MAG: Serine/threonine-protein kinase pkn1 [Bacteroidetes bacterium ADurb.Bin408]|nr:MAG: Serine/threonine-protein kinase pkn1 [Bacteroidetes bacterium ADurb.Bin408]
MAQVEIYAKRIQSKHALFLFDACFAGSLFDMRSPVTEAITYKTTQQVRQFITSGSAEEQVPDVSIFRKQFVAALTTNEADYDKDGFVTGSELGQFLQTKVVNYSYNAQHPQYGKIRNPKLDKGDFVFELKAAKPAITESKPATAAPAKTIVVEEEKILTYGAIEVNTEIAGDLYLDGAFVKKATASSKLTLKNIETGSHTIEIRGSENWKNTAVVTKDQTAYLTAKTTLKPAVSNSFALNADFTVPVAGIDLKMRGIQGGTFTMGSSDSEAASDETPHTVTVGNFAMMKHEVTVAEFKKFIDDTGYQTDADKRTGNYGSYIWNGNQWEKKDGVNWKCGVNGSLRPQSEYNHPVIHVSWNDAVAYAEWLSKKTSQTWRLPTEAEWEYAAKGGQNYKYAGSDNIAAVAWYNDNSGMKTQEVGQKSPNGFGLYDMTGNVWEWCSDWYKDDYYKTSGSSNPQGPSTGSYRVLRGGSWYYEARGCRSTGRDSDSPDDRSGNTGFRLVFVP